MESATQTIPAGAYPPDSRHRRLARWLARGVDSGRRDDLRASFSWLYGFIAARRLALGGLLALALLASLLTLLQPWLMKRLLDDALIGRDPGLLARLAVVMITVGVLATALAGLNRYLYTRLSGQILFALRADLYRHLQTLSPAFFGARRTGDLLSRLDGDVAEIQRFAVDSLFSAVTSLIGLIGALALMFVLSWRLSLLLLLLLPVEILWLRWMRKKVERHARHVRERAADLSSFFIETLPAMKFIQSVRQEAREARRLEDCSRHYLAGLLGLQRAEFFTHAIPGTLTSITRASAFLIGGYWVIDGSWQLGALIAFSTYLGMACAPAGSLLGLYVALQRMSVSLLRVAELRKTAPAVRAIAARADETPDAERTRIRGEIRLEHVHFTYPNRADPVLSDADAIFPAGSRIALSGVSGAGKSTLADLLQRHFDPGAGCIRLDGVDLRAMPLAQVRAGVAVVSQEIFLFRGTLADNIRYVAPKTDDAAVRRAARRAQLDELTAQLPQGLETVIGERGQQLSGGQKQRLAIARALLQSPAILVLDEATSAVDEATEARIIAEVDALFGDRTRIFISHRAATLRDCDLAFTLAGGRLTRYTP
ncbi:MAG: ABC transporter ATP-binding protein/permease [Azoarcus sp.]|jgi:ATP-binding cassette subfamily B protein|nr:ABC transporter ATP-binding protein/permease [Azoarcus sp.]